MRLVVFDLDTALCQSSTMDGLALAKAIKDVANLTVAPDSLESVTDLKALWWQLTGRPVTATEHNELRTRFSFHLRRQFIIRPSVISAQYELIEQVNRLQHEKRIVVGFVSPLTQQALELKARAIGLLLQSTPVATGDDAESLDGILQTLKTRVRRSYGISFQQAQLVAGATWRDAARSADITLLSNADFLRQYGRPPAPRRPFFSVPTMAWQRG